MARHGRWEVRERPRTTAELRAEPPSQIPKSEIPNNVYLVGAPLCNRKAATFRMNGSSSGI
jgi:hypothetical protein